jgi:hypothetical protein
LRGERSRFQVGCAAIIKFALSDTSSLFQLFGDTMNIAESMEHSCEGGRIQISRETADLIIQAGKSDWLQKREKTTPIKGKGQLETYWLLLSEDRPKFNSAALDLSETARSTAIDEPFVLGNKIDEKTTRLIGWNIETLSSLLRKIVARQIVLGYGKLDSPKREVVDESAIEFNNETFLDEVAEIITLSSKVCELQNIENFPIPDKVIHQLKDYVESIANMYNSNPFHNCKSCD